MDVIKLFKNADKVRENIYKEYNITEKDVGENVRTIKKWLETQSHLPEMIKDTHIRNFLIMNKFSVEKTKQKIDMYYTVRSLVPDFYCKANPKSPEMKKLEEIVQICILPNLWQDKHIIYMSKFNSSETFSIPEVSMKFCNISEIRLHEDCMSRSLHIIDMTNFTFAELTKMTPVILKKTLFINEKVFSFQITAIYLINAPPLVSKLLALLKTLMKPKLFKRIHVFENSDILKEIFTLDTLPKDYGGNGPSFKQLEDILKAKIDEYQKRFDLLDELRVNEDLRPVPLSNDETLGFHGHFKKLDVD